MRISSIDRSFHLEGHIIKSRDDRCLHHQCIFVQVEGWNGLIVIAVPLDAVLQILFLLLRLVGLQDLLER